MNKKTMMALAALCVLASGIQANLQSAFDGAIIGAQAGVSNVYLGHE
jgi:hypothetical protein